MEADLLVSFLSELEGSGEIEYFEMGKGVFSAQREGLCIVASSVPELITDIKRIACRRQVNGSVGRFTSPAKAAAVRENGKKGGRPRKIVADEKNGANVTTNET